MSSVTIKDIAKALNISTSTVSRALRDSYHISEETKKMVVEYAKKMNYRPNPIALSLKENRSRSIGVIVPEIANNFFSQAINGIEDIAYNRGYHVVIFQSHELMEREKTNVQHLSDRKVDGLLISLSGTTTDISHLENQSFPIVYFDRVPEKSNSHKVVVDNFDGAFKATEFLLKNGKKTIAHITSPPVLSITKERVAGYKSALEKYGIEIDEDLIRYSNFSLEEVSSAIQAILNDFKPDAFFLGSDRVALACFKAFKKLDTELQKNISLIGFTNLGVAELLEPPLNTISQPAFKMGQKAAEILLGIIENKKKNPIPYETITLETELHIRQD